MKLSNTQSLVNIDYGGYTLIKFLKVRDVASPEREVGNAGFDFFVPAFNDKFIADCAAEGKKNPKAECHFMTDADSVKCILVKPGERVSIPSGIKSYLSLGMPLCSYGLEMDLVVENKSGVATKKGLDVGAVEIDPNYQGEIHLSLTNASNEDVCIQAGDKITQLVPRVYCTEKPVIVDEAEQPDEAEKFWDKFKYNNRGEGWAGSTGTKA